MNISIIDTKGHNMGNFQQKNAEVDGYVNFKSDPRKGDGGRFYLFSLHPALVEKLEDGDTVQLKDCVDIQPDPRFRNKNIPVLTRNKMYKNVEIIHAA